MECQIDSMIINPPSFKKSNQNAFKYHETELKQSEYYLNLFWKSQIHPKPFETMQAIMDIILDDDDTSKQMVSLQRLQLMNESDCSMIEMSKSKLDYHYERLMDTRSYVKRMKKGIHTKTIDDKKRSFMISLAYRGKSFCGWQIQQQQQQQQQQHMSKPSIQETISNCLDPILNPHSPMESIYKPIDIRVCGRTDAGVNAFQQICRVRTTSTIANNVTNICHAIQEAINDSSNHQHQQNKKSFYCLNVQEVNSSFHPSFCTKCRAYAYFIDINKEHSNGWTKDFYPTLNKNHIPLLNTLFQALEGKELDYFAYSHGKVKTETTLCTLYHSRVSLVTINTKMAICIELVGDRFLRRMVRKLVSTAIREVLDVHHPTSNHHLFSQIDTSQNNILENSERLLSIAQSKRRDLTARAAPPDGLVFVGADLDNDYIL